jgi:hypothetical protein
MASLSNLTKEQLIRKYQNMDKQRRQAWAKYYDLEKRETQNLCEVVKVIKSHKEDIPEHFKNEFIELCKKYAHLYECQVCMNNIDTENMTILRCGHKFCKECIKEWGKTNPTCPICRKKFYVSNEEEE